jgi:hypothetical protein
MSEQVSVRARRVDNPEFGTFWECEVLVPDPPRQGRLVSTACPQLPAFEAEALACATLRLPDILATWTQEQRDMYHQRVVVQRTPAPQVDLWTGLTWT